jgi:hypothetical protein
MASALATIRPALEILADNVSILPARGGAVEDLQRPDADERDDAEARASDDDVSLLGETAPQHDPLTYIPAAPVSRSNRHLFRYFIDGSLRTYFVATGIQQNRTFPIEIAQIGSACLFRRDDGRMTVHKRFRKILLLAPKGADGLSEDVWKKLEGAFKGGEEFELCDTSQSGRADARRTDARTHAGGKARRRMHNIEVDIIDSTSNGNPARSPGAWAILDGGIRLGDFIDKPHVLAVAKSFDTSIRFFFGSRPRERFDITRLLRDLPPAHRTSAFFADSQKHVVFWYVRLWDKVDLDYPLMGVVKLEVGSPSGAEVETDLINDLSSCVTGERSVTPYGKDNRWHTHLYPIYCAENAIKSNFFGEEALLAQFRWPRRSATQDS